MEIKAGDNEIRIIDNFLSEYHFERLQSLLMGGEIGWSYIERIVDYKDTNVPLLCHMFYNGMTQKKGLYFSFIEPCLTRLGSSKLYRIKANLNFKSVFRRNTGYHVDGLPCSQTALLYITTNNGYTKFKKGPRVKCVENVARGFVEVNEVQVGTHGSPRVPSHCLLT